MTQGKTDVSLERARELSPSAQHPTVRTDGPSEYLVARDARRAHVEHHAIEVEEHAFAQVDVLAVVAVERRLHPHAVAAGAEQFSQNSASLVGFTLA